MADIQPPELKRFSAAELATFNGKAGRPAYVAYKGKVYDVSRSKLWRNGVHVRAHSAGEELTGAMLAAPHGDDVMEEMPIVGVLWEELEVEAETKHPWFVSFSLDHHLHPIAVHFPTALGAVSPAFALASFFFTGGGGELYRAFQHAAFWCLVVCFLASFPAVLTGWLSWYYNYSAVMTPIYRVKWGGSIALLVLATAALLVKLFALGGLAAPDPGLPATWVYTGLLVLIAAAVTVLGHFGGKITFPS